MPCRAPPTRLLAPSVPRRSPGPFSCFSWPFSGSERFAGTSAGSSFDASRCVSLASISPASNHPVHLSIVGSGGMEVCSFGFFEPFRGQPPLWFAAVLRPEPPRANGMRLHRFASLARFVVVRLASGWIRDSWRDSREGDNPPGRRLAEHAGGFEACAGGLGRFLPLFTQSPS